MNGTVPIGGSKTFWAAKRGFDIIFALCVIPIITLLGLFLVLVNPVYNRGPLFFTQTRMGLNCQPFTAIKFRTMVPVAKITRGTNTPLETDRITAIGGWLRRTRFDELPQVINILLGDMSLLGPRPEMIEHAEKWIEALPAYRNRHVVRPGMSGLAQVRQGYTDSEAEMVQKVDLDLKYIREAGFQLEARLLWETFITVARGDGH